MAIRFLALQRDYLLKYCPQEKQLKVFGGFSHELKMYGSRNGDDVFICDMNQSSNFSIPIDVRFRDVDVLGHVNNAVFITYFEEGRKSFFLSHTSDGDPLEWGFILARIECDYLKPVLLEDKLMLHMKVLRVGRKSFTFGYELADRSDPSRLFARAESVQVCFDYRKQVSEAIPDKLVKVLEGYMQI